MEKPRKRIKTYDRDICPRKASKQHRYRIVEKNCGLKRQTEG
jgi:hypothetical protein